MRDEGFTLIEILIVVGIIGIIGVASAIAINSARSRMRDAKRVSDVRQMQSVLEDYFKENNAYPAGEALRLGDPTASGCLSNLGFSPNCSGAAQVFMPVVPTEFTKGIDKDVKCGNPPAAGYCYTAANESGTYKLEFELERSIVEAGILKGPNCLIPEAGIRSGRCQ